MSKVPFDLHMHHVGYFVTDMDKTIQWYEEMLGFELAHRAVYDLPQQGPTQMCWIKRENYWIELYQYDNELEPFSIKNYLGTIGCKHVCFYVSNEQFPALRKHLKDKGANVFVDICWPNDQTGEIVRPLPADADENMSTGVIYVADPDGMWIEIQGEFYPGIGATQDVK